MWQRSSRASWALYMGFHGPTPTRASRGGTPTPNHPAYSIVGFRPQSLVGALIRSGPVPLQPCGCLKASRIQFSSDSNGGCWHGGLAAPA